MANDTLDLLTIGDTLNDINGEEIGTDKDYGMNFNYLYVGMSGQKMIDAINSNFHATDAEFLAQSNAILVRIISEDIKEMKVENNIVYYTTSTEEPLEWKSLAATWRIYRWKTIRPNRFTRCFE